MFFISWTHRLGPAVVGGGQLLPALLFGLRHLPLDLYTGHVGLAGWAARTVELYGRALMLGLIRWRTRSVAPTVILHGLLWPLVIVGLLGTGVGAAIGAILGAVVIIYAALAAKKGIVGEG